MLRHINIQVMFLKKLLFLIIPLCLSFSILIYSCFNPISLVASVSDSVTFTVPVIIIDAGHGGFDGGAGANDGTTEKDINLSISLYLNEYLAAFGYKTVMTREKDISLENDGLDTIRSKKTSDIHNRMAIMENTDNSIFVSIHQNHYSVEKYNGAQVFYSPKNSDESSLLAQNIQETVVSVIQPNNTRLIKECGTSVYLMYNAVKPAVLVECGFLSNNEEAQKLKTEAYQKKMAFCIAIGIQNYIISRIEK